MDDELLKHYGRQISSTIWATNYLNNMGDKLFKQYGRRIT